MYALLAVAAAALFAATLAPSNAHAQSSTNVAAMAVDAFGEKVGSEQIGLYTEQQVRGFNLQDSGNFRLEGAYFIRSANIPEPALDRITIRVGINAFGVDFPAPSGVVDYRLIPVNPGWHNSLELGLRDWGGWATLLRGSVTTKDGTFGAAYGGSVIGYQTSDGVGGSPRHLTFLPRWRPNEQFQLKGIFTYDKFSRDLGNSDTALSGTVLPPHQPHPQTFPARWSRNSMTQINWGAIAQYAVTDHIGLQSSVIFSTMDRPQNDFTLLTIGADGKGTATAIRARPSDAGSTAAEVRGNWRVADDHRLFATARLRETKNNVREGATVPLGFVDQAVGTPATPAPPDPVELAPNRDKIDQITGGLGYETTALKGLLLRASALRTHYEKAVTPRGLPTQTNKESRWLYDLTASYDPVEALTFFATSVRGLEESGSAPNNAANANEVLPAVLATQYEAGVRYRIRPQFTFIGSVYEISKQVPGLDTRNVFGLISQARHRGLELSLAGRPAPQWNIVAGLALLDAARRGELVDRNLIIGRATGIPAVTGLLNVTYDFLSIDGFSLDAQVNYTSKRLLNSRIAIYTPPYATLDIGARYSFFIGKNPAVVRARIGNLFDEDQWIASRTETLSRVPRRAFRLSLTTSFDQGWDS